MVMSITIIVLMVLVLATAVGGLTSSPTHFLEALWTLQLTELPE